MSTILLSCPGCAATLRVRAEVAGKKIKCPKCGVVVRVPAESAEASGNAPNPVPPAEPQPVVLQLSPKPPGSPDGEVAKRPAPSKKPARKEGGGWVAAVLAVLLLVPFWTMIALAALGIYPKSFVVPVSDLAAKDDAWKKEPPLTGAVTATDEELANEFRANPLATRHKYSQAELTVSGIVERVPKDDFEKRIVLVLRGHPDRDKFFDRISVKFSAKDADQLNALVWGQAVKVRGKVDLKETLLGLTLAGGQLVEAGALPAAVAAFAVDDLMKEYFADPAAMGKKYKDQVVEFSGTVATAGASFNSTAVTLSYKKADNQIGSILCYVKGKDETRAYELSRGQAVKIRGRFSAGPNNQYPTLADGCLAEVGPDPALVLTAVELTKAVDADRDAAIREYSNKPWRLEAVIAAVKKTGGAVTLQLAGFNEGVAKPARVEVTFYSGGSKAEDDRFAAFKVGDAVWLRGIGFIDQNQPRITLSSPAVLTKTEKKSP